jgi:hypothetical protein
VSYNDPTVFVEDIAGDLGDRPAPGVPWWFSPDVLIAGPSPGVATTSGNTVQIRVHAHEEPILAEKINAEVYVGNPSLVMSPTANTKRIDPGNLKFRTIDVPGTEPVANTSGATTSFPWTPTGTTGDPDSAGHRCLVVRAFPESVTPPTGAFDVPNEQHEAQHNIEIVKTQMKMKSAYVSELTTVAAGKKKGPRFVVGAFDPRPDKKLEALWRRGFPKLGEIATRRPKGFKLEAAGAEGEPVSPRELFGKSAFVRKAGLGEGIWAKSRVSAGLRIELGPRKVSGVRWGLDPGSMEPGTAAVFHVAQFDERGRPEGGITVIAQAPNRRR